MEHAPAGMPAGWYRDSDPAQLRWWDGAHWTDRVKGAAEKPVPLNARSTPAALGEPLLERNRLSTVALAIGVVALAAVLALAGASLAGPAVPPWALPVVALGGGVLALLFGVLAGRRVEYTGEGQGFTVAALVLSGVLVLAGLTATVLQLALAAL